VASNEAAVGNAVLRKANADQLVIENVYLQGHTSKPISLAWVITLLIAVLSWPRS